MNRFYAISAAGVLVVAGCASPNVPLKESTPSSSPAFTTADTGPSPDPIVTPTNKPPATPESTAPPEDPGVAKVGATQWFTYEDGLKVQVTKLTRFKIGQYAAGGTPGGSGVIVTVTIRNGTKKTFDASSTTITVASGPNGDEADTVYDSDKGLSGGFEGSIAPGRVKTAKAGFAVPKAHMSQIQVEVVPGFLDYESSFFEGAAK